MGSNVYMCVGGWELGWGRQIRSTVEVQGYKQGQARVHGTVKVSGQPGELLMQAAV